MSRLLEDRRLLADFQKKYGPLFESSEFLSEQEKKKLLDRAKAVRDKAIEKAKAAYRATVSGAQASGKHAWKYKGRYGAAAALLGTAGYGAYRYGKSRRARANEAFDLFSEIGAAPNLGTSSSADSNIWRQGGKGSKSGSRILGDMGTGSGGSADDMAAYSRKGGKESWLRRAGRTKLGKYAKNPKVAIPAATAAALASYGGYRYAKARRARGANESEIIDTMLTVLKEGYFDLCPYTDNPGKCQRMIESRISKIEDRILYY